MSTSAHGRQLQLWRFLYRVRSIVYGLFAFLGIPGWHLGGLARKNPELIGVLGWSLFTVQAVN